MILEYASILHNDVFTIEGNKGIKSYKYSIPFNFPNDGRETLFRSIVKHPNDGMRSLFHSVPFRSVPSRSADFILSKQSRREGKIRSFFFFCGFRFFFFGFVFGFFWKNDEDDDGVDEC